MRNEDLMKGVALGVGVAVLVPVAIAALAPVVKPLARSALKAGIRAYEIGRERIEEFGETVEDIVAEVEEELMDRQETGGPEEEAPEGPDDFNVKEFRAG
ncbi:MAG: DUF5132 domain-containing protein [Pseudomonadota bacterium]|nr:DUF5132 domain-containing protein [Pseudomonadota bacterium]